MASRSSTRANGSRRIGPVTEHTVSKSIKGFPHLGFKHDHELNAVEWIVYDALYAYCREMVKRGKPHGEFMN